MSSSTNTAARAIAELAKIGYVQSIRGKGVIVIYQGKAGSKEFSLGSIETMREAAERNHKTYRTKVEVFTTFPVDERISKRTGFDVGETVYYAQRVRFFDERPVILDNNWFLARIVKDLTPEICEKSVYQYMEHELGENIVTAKRVLTVEKATQVDRKYLDLRDFDCVAVVTSHTFNAGTSRISSRFPHRRAGNDENESRAIVQGLRSPHRRAGNDENESRATVQGSHSPHRRAADAETVLYGKEKLIPP